MSPCSICPLRFAGPPFCCSHTCAGGGISGKKQLQIAGCTCAHEIADNALRQGPHDRRHVGKGAGDCTRQRERNVHIGSQTCPGSERGRTHRAPGCRFPCRTDPPPCRKRRNERGLTRVYIHRSFQAAVADPARAGAPNMARKRRRIWRVLRFRDHHSFAQAQQTPSASPPAPRIVR